MEAGEAWRGEEIPIVMEWGREGKGKEVWEKPMMTVVKAGVQGAE